MKITRQKHAKKHIGFFRNNFGVREPYQILLDGTFCQAALRGRIQLREQLPRYLMGETQLCTTSRSLLCYGWGKGSVVKLQVLVPLTSYLNYGMLPEISKWDALK
uniref:UTP23 small subunit processome component n=1 Tax=Saimiri boliviensis boliviensis TaxID=39432 RepID=A0A2K6SB00_SAIBB